jgi:sugar lactone lactonase YvrE
MQKMSRGVFVLGLSVVLSACGGSAGTTSSGNTESSANAAPTTLAAGASRTMTANMSVQVPAGTIVSSPNGDVVTIGGTSNTIYTQAGAQVTVPANATGPANNLVTTAQATGNGITTSALTAVSMAGSPTTNLSPVDGTGEAAVLWGGGHLTVNASGDIVLSDRLALRRVTQSGVVTTLSSAAEWDGVAIDAAGNIYGSGNTTLTSTSPFTLGGSLSELTASGVYQQLFANWATASSGLVGGGGLVADNKGNLFLADAANNRIVKFNLAGNTWTVLAGSGTSGNVDGVGSAATFSFNGTPDLAIDSSGDLYVKSLDAVRKIAPDGTVTTVASKLSNASSAIAVDSQGNVYAAGVQIIYRIAANGSMVSYPFSNSTDFITSMTTDSAGNLYVGTRGVGAQVFKITF